MSRFTENRGVTLLGVLIFLGFLSFSFFALGRSIALIERLKRETRSKKEALFLAVNTLEHLKKEPLQIPTQGEVSEGNLRARFRIEEFSEDLLLFKVEVFEKEGRKLYALETLAFK
ncbi:hypothetical protein QBE54_07050 [Thermatribacter velox]|jgi:hypothetical protein|uniref:DUF4845 domain-containing protein n=1 Tax=Thermatribacter velox TaxID=3039681 RepID=A0ABZ2Y8L1_9BACT